MYYDDTLGGILGVDGYNDMYKLPLCGCGWLDIPRASDAS